MYPGHVLLPSLHCTVQGYEKFDPETWLTLCDSGLSPMFTGGVWKWMPVSVLGYVVADGRYVVEFKGTGKRKAVKRINLVFDREDKVWVRTRLHLRSCVPSFATPTHAPNLVATATLRSCRGEAGLRAALLRGGSVPCVVCGPALRGTAYVRVRVCGYACVRARVQQANFCARLRSAIIFREKTKAAIRFQHFVDSAPADAIAPVSDSWLKSIHSRATSFVARRAAAAALLAAAGGKASSKSSKASKRSSVAAGGAGVRAVRTAHLQGPWPRTTPPLRCGLVYRAPLTV